MLNIVLYQPQIPPNTGNIVRLCVNTGSKLHLIKPLGFKLDDKSCKRAGLDHFEIEKISLWNSFAEYKENIISKKLWAVTKFGNLPYNKANICSPSAGTYDQ